MQKNHLILIASSILFQSKQSIHDLRYKVRKVVFNISKQDWIDMDAIRRYNYPVLIDLTLWKLRIGDNCYLERVDSFHPNQQEVLHVTSNILEYVSNALNPNHELVLQAIAICAWNTPMKQAWAYQLGKGVRVIFNEQGIPYPKFKWSLLPPRTIFRFPDGSVHELLLEEIGDVQVHVTLQRVEHGEDVIDIADDLSKYVQASGPISKKDIELSLQLVAVILLNTKAFKVSLMSIATQLNLLIVQWNQLKNANDNLPSTILTSLPTESFVKIQQTHYLIRRNEIEFGLYISDENPNSIPLDEDLLDFIPKNRLFTKEQAKGYKEYNETVASDMEKDKKGDTEIAVEGKVGIENKEKAAEVRTTTPSTKGKSLNQTISDLQRKGSKNSLRNSESMEKLVSDQPSSKSTPNKVSLEKTPVVSKNQVTDEHKAVSKTHPIKPHDLRHVLNLKPQTALQQDSERMKRKQKNEIVQITQKELTLVVQLITVCVLQRPSLKANSTVLGSDIRKLLDFWNQNSAEKQFLPQKIFTPLPDKCNVQVGSILYEMEKVHLHSGVEMCLKVVEKPDEDYQLFVVDQELVDILQSDASEEEEEVESESEELDASEEEKVDRMLQSAPIMVDSVGVEVFGSKLRNFYKSHISSSLLQPGARFFLAKKLEGILSTPEYPVQVLLFGSSVNNLGFKGSDVDITIIPVIPDAQSLSKEEISAKYVELLRDHPLKRMYGLAKKLRAAKMGKVIPIGHARVPICKFYDPTLRLSCDINFGHAIGFHNSRLLYAYTKLDPRVKPLIMLVKYWAKMRDINDPAVGHTISSYAWSIMVISFMIHHGYIKSLQDSSIQLKQSVIRVAEVNLKSKTTVDRLIDVTACYDLKDPFLQETKSKEFSDLWTTQDGVASLFSQFLEFYGYKYQYKPNVAVSIHKQGGIVKIVPTENRRLVVMDPFEAGRNCTGMVQNALPTIIEEFRSAHRLLVKGNIDQIFMKVERDHRTRFRKPN